MSARSRVAVALAAGLALATMTVPGRPATAATGSRAALLDRAFTVLAEGYPVEPAPGSQSQPIAIRPASSRISLANPPATAYARAAAADLGLAESYFGQQGPSVEVDTAIEDQPREGTVDADGTRLHAVVTEAPSAESTAEIVSSGTGVSASHAMGALSSDGPLVAAASSEVRDVTVGPLAVQGARFEATARTTGLPGGGEGSGQVTVSGATIGGLPVVVDDTGVRIDETEIPVALLSAATSALQELLAQGGYSSIRVLQPTVTVAPDGTRVEVSGGGIALYLTNNDPSNLYFASLRALGGRVLIAVGDDIGTAGPDRPTTPTGPIDSPAIDSGSAEPSGGTPGFAGPAPADPALAATTPIELAYQDTGARTELRGIWPGYPWVLLGAAMTIGASLAVVRTKRGRRVVDHLLDGYLRG